MTVGYVDGHGTAEMLTSAPTAAVANVDDAPTGLPVIAGVAVEDGMLTVDTSAIADADGLGAFSIQWRRDGAAIAGATGTSYSPGDADVGARISVTVGYVDGHGTAQTLTSAPTAAVANVDDAPVIVLPDGSDPVRLRVDEGRTDVVTLVATDADGDELDWSIVGGADADRYTIDAASGRLRFATAPDFESPGDADADNRYTVVVQADDRHGGTARRTIEVTVADVNEAPAATGGQIVLLEDATRVVRIADLGATDPDVGDRIAAVQVVGWTGAGALTLGGAAVRSGQWIAAAEIDAMSLAYTPPADANGSALATLVFRVADRDGLVSATTATLVFDVVAVNDPPRLVTVSPLQVDEGATAAIGPAQLHAVDVDDSPQQLRYRVVTPPASGRLEIDGVAVTGFTQADVDGGRLFYLHGGSETATDSFTFVLSDAAGAALGSVSLSIAVAPVDDAPVLTLSMAAPADVTAGGPQQRALSAATLTDADSVVFVRAVVRIAAGYLPGQDRLVLGGNHTVSAQWDAATGTLTISGAATAAAYADALASVQFSSAAAGSGERLLSVQVSDGTADSQQVQSRLGVRPAAPAAPASPTMPSSPAVHPSQQRNDHAVGSTSVPSASTAVTAPDAAPIAAGKPAEPAGDNAATGDPTARAAAAAAAAGGTATGGHGGTRTAGDASAPEAGVNIQRLLEIALDGTRVDQPADGELLPGLERPELAELRRAESADGARRNATGADVRKLVELVGTPAPDDGGFSFEKLAEPTVGGGLALSASVLWWATRAGGLMAAMFASVPAWRSFDPTPILERRRGTVRTVDDDADDDLLAGPASDADSAASDPAQGPAPHAALRNRLIEEMAGPA